MAAKGQRIGALRWDIVADNSQLVKTIKGSNRMTKDLSRAMKMTRTPMQRYTKGLMDARAAIKRGAIDGKAYRYELKRLQKQLGTEQLALNRSTAAYNRNTKAKIANRVAGGGRGKGAANLLGSTISGLGLGGASAGIGRSAGLLGGGGLGGVAAGYGLSQLMLHLKAAKEYSRLETDITELQVFMGKKQGKEYAEQFRNIARESSLTTSQLVKNASVIKSYGVELEDIVDFTTRLGEASGGDSAQFGLMTKAFAQINALGKLMGQEKNQLVNAGFSLKLIAREAGIPMENFAKAMENGLITAEHVNAALITATNEGGLFYGRLLAKANTLAGKWDILKNSSNEMFAMMGMDSGNWWKATLDSLTESINNLAEQFSDKNKIKELKAEEQYYKNRLAPPVADKRGSFGRDAHGNFTGNPDIQWTGPNGTGAFNRELLESPAGTGLGDYVGSVVSTWAAVLSGASTFAEAANYNEEQRMQQKKEELRQQQLATERVRKLGKAAGIDPYDPDGDDSPFDDANLVDMSGRRGSGGQSGGIPSFGAGSIDEYNFLRDKLTADRDLAKKSYDALITIAQNTGGEPGNNQSWRSKAREGLKERRWRQDQMANVATDLYGWAMQGFRTDEQVKADMHLNEIGEVEGGTLKQEIRAMSGDVYDKYDGGDGLLSTTRTPDGRRITGANGLMSERALYDREVRETTAELKAQHKRRMAQENRNEEIKQIKRTADETHGVKGVLTNIFNHMQKTATQMEAL